MTKKIISFPNLANYDVPVKFLFEKLTDYEVRKSPPMTRKTLELGSKYSPDYVCMPFKYTLGNYIESLDNGANILIQAGGGCRFGYYFELQKKILEDLGYKFKYITGHNYGAWSRKITNVSLMLGGWIKSCQKH